jgi:NOL1/NOP2/fmu family ribosome biogenesis protein
LKKLTKGKVKNNMEKTLAFQAHKIKSFQPIKDSIIVADMVFDERISHGGIVLMNDDMKSAGIRPRWAKVYAVGPEQVDIKVGQYVLISHGRWTRGVKIEDSEGEKTIRKVDNNDILIVSDEPMSDHTMGDKVY